MKLLLQLLQVITIFSPTAAIICAFRFPPLIPDDVPNDCSEDPSTDNKFCAWFELDGNRYAGCSTKGVDGCKKDGDLPIIISGHTVTAHCCSYNYCNKSPRMYMNDMPEQIKLESSPVRVPIRHLSVGPVVVGEAQPPLPAEPRPLDCNPKSGTLCGLRSLPKGLRRSLSGPDDSFCGILRGVSVKQAAVISLISVILFSCFLIVCQLIKKGFSGKRCHLAVSSFGINPVYAGRNGFVPLENEKPVYSSP